MSFGQFSTIPRNVKEFHSFTNKRYESDPLRRITNTGNLTGENLLIKYNKLLYKWTILPTWKQYAIADG